MNNVTAEVKQVKPEIVMHFIVLKISVKIHFNHCFPGFGKGIVVRKVLGLRPFVLLLRATRRYR
jgi:hypothetical protein